MLINKTKNTKTGYSFCREYPVLLLYDFELFLVISVIIFSGKTFDTIFNV